MELGLAHTRTEKENSPIVFSPYATVWADGYYYVLAKEENADDISHLRIDLLQDIVLLERGADMLCGGLNPIQYAREFILLKGERKERFEIECSRALWQSLAEDLWPGGGGPAGGRRAYFGQNPGHPLRHAVLGSFAPKQLRGCRAQKLPRGNPADCDGGVSGLYIYSN